MIAFLSEMYVVSQFGRFQRNCLLRAIPEALLRFAWDAA